MKYTYTVFDSQGTRREVFTRAEEVAEKYVTNGFYTEVYNNLTNKLDYTLKTIDDLEGFIVAQERNTAWCPPTLNLADNNLKTLAAVGKPIVSSVPPIALLALGMAMEDGVKKYGKFNWRDAAVTSSVFYDAIERHLIAWYSGEEHASDSKIHHLAHVMAGCAIILDAMHNGVLNDDRKPGQIVTKDTIDLLRAK